MPRRGRDRQGSEPDFHESSHTPIGTTGTAAGQAATLLGELEAAIMAHCWAAADAAGALDGAPQTVAEMQQALDAAGRGSAYTTVMTVMGRLVEKGLLARSESLGRSGPGSGYRYWPAQSEAAFVAAASRERVSALIATFGDVALAQFADALGTLDPERLAALTRLGHADPSIDPSSDQSTDPSTLHAPDSLQPSGSTDGRGHASGSHADSRRERRGHSRRETRSMHP